MSFQIKKGGEGKDSRKAEFNQPSIEKLWIDKREKKVSLNLNEIKMKTKIVSFFILAAIASIAGWNVFQSGNEAPLTDLALNNVEALANEPSNCPNGCLENGDGCWCNGWHSCLLEQDSMYCICSHTEPHGLSMG